MKRFLFRIIFSIIFTTGCFTNILNATIIYSNPILKQNPTLSLKTNDNEAEYIIITYNQAGFVEKLMELQQFRIAQGISTKIITTSEIGGNSVDTIKDYIYEAYTNWDIPPNVILLVSDHEKIPGPAFQSGQKQKTDISDNYYVDVDGDNLPDMTIARLPVEDLFNLTNYIDRIIVYETSPPYYMNYYNHPVIL